MLNGELQTVQFIFLHHISKFVTDRPVECAGMLANEIRCKRPPFSYMRPQNDNSHGCHCLPVPESRPARASRCIFSRDFLYIGHGTKDAKIRFPSDDEREMFRLKGLNLQHRVARSAQVE